MDVLPKRVGEELLEVIEGNGQEETNDEEVVDNRVLGARAEHTVGRDNTPDDRS